MTDVSYTLTLDAEDFEDGLAGAAAQADAVAGKIEVLGRRSDSAAGSMSKAGGQTSRWGGGLQKLASGGLNLAALGAKAFAAAAVAAGAAAVTAAQGVIRLSEAGSEQQAVNRRLSSALTSVSADAAEAEARFVDLSAAIAEQAGATQFGDEQISDALSTYITLTGDAEAASDDLSTILGLAEQRQIDAAQAAKLVAQARRGEVEQIKEALPLTREQINEINSLTDASERGARVTELLQDRYAGQAETAGTARGAIKNLSDASGDLVQMIGMIVNASGVIPAVLGPVTELFRDLEAGSKQNSAALQDLTLDIAAGVVTALEVATLVIFELVRAGIELYGGLELIGEGFEIMLSAAEITGRGLIDFGASIIGGVIERLKDFTDTAADVARAVGADGLAAQLEGASSAAGDFKANIEGMQADNLAGIREEMDNIDRSGDEAEASLRRVNERVDAARDVMEGVQEATDGMRDNLARARTEVEPLGTGYQKVASSSGDAADNTKKIADNTARAAGLTQEEFFLQAQQLDLEHELLEAQQREDALAEARAQYALDLLAVEQAKLGAEDEALAAQIERNGLLSAELSYRERVATIQQDEDAAAIASREQALAAQSDVLGERAELLSSAAAALSQVSSGLDSDFGRVVDGLSGVSSALLDAAASYKTLRAEGMSANAAVASAGANAAGVIGDAVASQIEDTGKASALRGLFAAAESALYFATGNIPQGAAAAAAAGLHFAVAAKAGAGSGGAGGATVAGGGPATTGRVGRDPAEEREKLAEAITRGLDGAGSGGETVLMFDFSNSVNLEDSPATARRVTESVRRELENQGIQLARSI